MLTSIWTRWSGLLTCLTLILAHHVLFCTL
nr:MAG TPA: hypothetical protein [Caudoviricetes sp.]